MLLLLSFVSTTSLEIAIGATPSSATTAQTLPSSRPSTHAAHACSPKELFYAAVRKEHFNPNDPSYVAMGMQPTAEGAICNAGWAFAFVSRPNVGTTDGATLFRRDAAGTWVEVRAIGYTDNACAFTELGVPAKIAIILSRGVAGGEYCDLPHAFSIARRLWVDGRCAAPVGLESDWPSIAQILLESRPAYGGNPTAYKTAIGNLGRVATILKSGDFMLGPGTDGTWLTSRNPAFATAIGQIDEFFHTPNFFSSSTMPACYTS